MKQIKEYQYTSIDINYGKNKKSIYLRKIAKLY